MLSAEFSVGYVLFLCVFALAGAYFGHLLVAIHTLKQRSKSVDSVNWLTFIQESVQRMAKMESMIQRIDQAHEKMREKMKEMESEQLDMFTRMDKTLVRSKTVLEEIIVYEEKLQRRHAGILSARKKEEDKDLAKILESAIIPVDEVTNGHHAPNPKRRKRGRSNSIRKKP